jgi:uncharacterized DUF497 family protein
LHALLAGCLAVRSGIEDVISVRAAALQWEQSELSKHKEHSLKALCHTLQVAHNAALRRETSRRQGEERWAPAAAFERLKRFAAVHRLRKEGYLAEARMRTELMGEVAKVNETQRELRSAQAMTAQCERMIQAGQAEVRLLEQRSANWAELIKVSDFCLSCAFRV